MNKAERVQVLEIIIQLEELATTIKTSDIQTAIKLEELSLEIMSIADKEQEKYDNAPDGLIDSERFENIQENADDLYSAADDVDYAAMSVKDNCIDEAIKDINNALEYLRTAMR